jgi:hypothetical protein
MYGVRHDVYPKPAPAPLNHAGTTITQKGNEKNSLQNPKEPNNLPVKWKSSASPLKSGLKAKLILLLLAKFRFAVATNCNEKVDQSIITLKTNTQDVFHSVFLLPGP